MGNRLPHGLGRSGHWRECYEEASEGSTARNSHAKLSAVLAASYAFHLLCRS
jgi:hypothetical protein